MTARIQIHNTLEAQTTENSNKANSRMQELAEIGVQENRLIKTLTMQTTSETKFMSTITLISAIFLPATFLAVSENVPELCHAVLTCWKRQYSA